MLAEYQLVPQRSTSQLSPVRQFQPSKSADNVGANLSLRPLRAAAPSPLKHLAPVLTPPTSTLREELPPRPATASPTSFPDAPPAAPSRLCDASKLLEEMIHRRCDSGSPLTASEQSRLQSLQQVILRALRTPVLPAPLDSPAALTSTLSQAVSSTNDGPIESLPARGENLISPANRGLVRDASTSRLKKNLDKIRALGQTHHVYKRMVLSSENMETMYSFATRCSEAPLGTKSVVETIEEEFRSTCAAAGCRLIMKDELAASRAALDAAVAAEIEATFQSGVIRNDTVNGRLFVPLKGDDSEINAVAFASGVGSSETEARESALLQQRGQYNIDINLIENVSRVASLFIRNNLSYIEASWHRRKAEAMWEMANRLTEHTLDELSLSRSILSAARQLIGADHGCLYLVDEQGAVVATYDETAGHRAAEVVSPVAQHVATSGVVFCVDDAYMTPLFDSTADKAAGCRTGPLLCVPVQYEGAVVAIAELSRLAPTLAASTVDDANPWLRPFSARDIDILVSFSTFVGVSLRNCRVNARLAQEKRKSEAILEVVGTLSTCDIRNVQSVVRHVLQGARRLLGADRATLFLVDKERNELYSTVADDTGGAEIRFPVGIGIAGSVAKTGVAENIRDAYADARFNRAFDVQLGYLTRSMLTEPILFHDEVIAVAQIVNKLRTDGSVTFFTTEDQELFRAFSLFAGISLSNSHLLEFAVRAGQEAMELQATRDGIGQPRVKPVVRQQTQETVSDALVHQVLGLELEQLVKDTLLTNQFDIFGLREEFDNAYDLSVRCCVALFEAQGSLARFGCPADVMCRFVLACRDKYRFVPYHNFYHAVDVCQTLYTFLYCGGGEELLTPIECYVLLITALVHDLDHMGLNNSFHLKTDSPLGMLSSASGNNSVLEVHHCNEAIIIIGDANKNIFCGLDTKATTLAYRRLIDCVLATDMARHQDLVSQFEAMCTSPPGYQRDNDDHRRLLMMMLLKAADISNITKPFGISRKWGMSVTEEFYQQGDKEKAKGVAPLPMFDRSQNNELAKGQIGFISFVGESFFNKLTTNLCKGMIWCANNVAANKAEWKRVLDKRLGSAGSTR